MRVSGGVVIRCVVLALVHFATVEHQDNQANDKGAGQFEGACAHQRDEAEHATPIPLKVLPNMLSCSFLLLRSRNHNIGISASKRGCEYIVLTYYLSNLRKLILKVVPFPTVDCLTNIFPLWYSTIILFAKLKPKPHPLCFEEYPG